MQCPMCGKMIPANSVFCPKCGKMVRNDMEEETVEQADTAAAGQTYYEQQRQQQAEQQRREQERLRRQQAARQQTNAWEKEEDDEDDDDDEEQGGSNFNRNLLIGLAAVAVIIGGLMLLRGCGGSSDNHNEEEKTDSTLVTEVTSQDPLAILSAELNRNNLMGDGASASAAVMVKGDGNEVPDRIWGVTYLSNAAERSFFKIYQLTRMGSIWNPEMLQVKYLEGRPITMDNSKLMADIQQVPRAVKIDGKEYLYFAYMEPLGGEGAQGRVTLNVFDVKAKKLTAVDYIGTIKSRSDGRQYIHCTKPLTSSNSNESRFLEQEAKNIKVLYFPTEEELKAEKEAQEKEEMERKMASPDSADARWKQENQEKVEQAKSGEEVTMKKSTYDKPIFRKEDISNQIHSEGYSVFLTKNGSVYGFDKNTRKYFTIYSKGASEIGFHDSKNHLLGIKTSNGGHYQYNLSTGSLKSIK